MWSLFKKQKESKLSASDKKLIKDKTRRIHELETEIKILQREIDDIKNSY